MKLKSDIHFIDAEMDGEIVVAYVEEQCIRHAPSTEDLHMFVRQSVPEAEGREIRIMTRTKQ